MMEIKSTETAAVQRVKLRLGGYAVLPQVATLSVEMEFSKLLKYVMMEILSVETGAVQPVLKSLDGHATVLLPIFAKNVGMARYRALRNAMMAI